MLDALWAALFTALCWWFGTGVILWLDRLPVRSFRWSLAAWSGLLLISFWGVWHSMQSVSVANAYVGFASVIVMWGWHELAFLTGWLTGPRRQALSPGAQGWQRFAESASAVLWHELALLANLGLLWWMQGGRPNHVALCTFALLWCMRLSAKLNLFFGVAQNGAQYLPAHLKYLSSYFRSRSMTPWFVLSVGCASALWLWLIWLAQQGVVAVTTGWVLLATLLGLAIVEHLLMVLPWPMHKLWGWALGHPAAITPLRSES
jgi:putative photosynthetic complex assembly protein 2